MFTDFVVNGNGYGVGAVMEDCQWNDGLLRPYFDPEYGNEKCVTVNTGRKYNSEKQEYETVEEQYSIREAMDMGYESPVFNATALRKDQWIMLDQAVLTAARARLRAWGDLAAANTFGGFDGFAHSTLEHETMSDPGEALVDMDGLSEGRSDSPRFQLESLPLPITHSDFWFSSRKRAISRNGSMPIDTTMAEAAARRVAEKVEKTLIGIEPGISYGATPPGGRNSTVFGYTNFPDRLTKSDLTTPDGTNPNDTLTDVLEMRDLLYDNNFFGPFMLYHSRDWDKFLDNDYGFTGGGGTGEFGFAPTQTLRNRLRAIEGIQDVRRLDYFTDTFSLIMVQMTSDVARAVNGMNMTTVQWESRGGMKLNFKVMAIHVPQLRADFNSRAGILHATTE